MAELDPLKDARNSWDAPEDDYPDDEPAYKKPAPAPASGGLFKEVNDLRKVNRTPDQEDNAKYKDSPFGRLAGNKKFEALTFVFIGVNSLYIGIDADYNARTGKPDNLWDKDTPVIFKIMENVFCIYFTAEVLIRFIGYKIKRNCIFDGWFVFDGILVLFMVLETWIFPIFGLAGQLAQFSVLRLLRLLRISRMARLMKKVPELMIIIKGLIASFRSVGCTAILQVLILYVWSILFVSEYHEGVVAYVPLPDGEEAEFPIEDSFGSMGKSMFTLFIMGTVLDDVTAVTDQIRATENLFMLSLFIVFILISSFTILNMLIGILCEVVSATAESEKTKAAETSVKEAITSLFDKMDVDGSGAITQEEFMHMREHESGGAAVRQALEDMDIYESHFHRYCEILFQSQPVEPGKEPTITFDVLITMILRLSPGNHINALDFSLLQASIDRSQEAIRERVMKIHEIIAGNTLSKPGAVLEDGSPKEQVKSMQSSEEEGLQSFDPRERSLLGGASASAVSPARDSAKGDAPPPPPNAVDGGDLRGAASNFAFPAKEYTLDMFGRTSDHQIIEELQRRLGVSAVEAGKAALNPLLSIQPQKEAFHSLGVPQD